MNEALVEITFRLPTLPVLTVLYPAYLQPAPTDGHGQSCGEPTTFQGSYDGQVGKGATQRFSRKIVRSDSNCIVTLTAISPVDEYKKGKLMNLWDAPKFSPSDVLKQSYKFAYQVDLLSTQDIEHTLANFDRLADRGCNHSSYPRELGFDYRNDQGAPVYCVKIGDKVQPVSVSCTLHRKGAVCSTYAILQAFQAEESISAVEGERQLRAAIEAIIAD